MPTLFTLDRVDISFSSARVLKNISFEINAGEFLGIIGPNGSGKSTLTRTLAGVLKPSNGAVMLEGKDVSRIPRKDLAKRLAVVPQDSPVAFDYTVMEVVLMGRSPYLGRFELETGDDLSIAADALKRANLLQMADRNVGTLSGGERQRVMVARALAQASDIIFLDEPTAHLDINYQVEVLHLVRREISENNKTGVVVLHDLNLAAEFCDRLVMLKDGEVFACGTPDEVITAENVQKVYGTAVWVRRHPTSGRPYVLSMGSQAVASKITAEAAHANSLKVHVICGGGSGGRVFAKLVEIGCEVTAGVINIGDTDQEAAESMGIEYVEDAPFSPISKIAEDANLEFIDRADAVLLGDVPFGSGNMTNLYAAVYAADNGKQVAIMGNQDEFGSRDFAGGKVTRTLENLVEHGAVVLESVDAAAGWVAKIRQL
ncbi:MAG: heme ABC transporter ATP-binding protein [Armatimonadota bacterium]